MFITNRTKIPREETRAGNKIWWLITQDKGLMNFEMRYVQLSKSGSTRVHGHPWEHEIYVTKGWGVLRSGGKDVEVMKGDAIYIAPGEEHQFLNPWEDPLEYVCIVPRGTESVMKQK